MAAYDFIRFTATASMGIDFSAVGRVEYLGGGVRTLFRLALVKGDKWICIPFIYGLISVRFLGMVGAFCGAYFLGGTLSRVFRGIATAVFTAIKIGAHFGAHYVIGRVVCSVVFRRVGRSNFARGVLMSFMVDIAVEQVLSGVRLRRVPAIFVLAMCFVHSGYWGRESALWCFKVFSRRVLGVGLSVFEASR